MISRRRLIAIAAAAAGVGLAPANRDGIYIWSGAALGAAARISIAGLAPSQAERVAHMARDEAFRLEAAFSLYRPDSELARLNRDGRLPHPSQDFRLLLGRSLAAWEMSGGAFNPALQPLWRHLARHFAEAGAGPPDPREIARALALADPARIELSNREVRLAPGMALSLNGIAQGYVTDCAAALLAAEGLGDILIDLGELRALPGRAWDVAIAGTPERVALSGRAIAQSAGSATPFTADGAWHHLLDPETGRSASRYATLTVAAPLAADADWLSTALYALPPERHAPVLARVSGAAARFTTRA